jgi:uncharacterized membrane protein
MSDDCELLYQLWQDAEKRAEDAWSDSYDKWETFQDETDFSDESTFETCGGGLAVIGGILTGGLGGLLMILGGYLVVWSSETDRIKEAENARQNLENAWNNAFESDENADELWCLWVQKCGMILD